MKPTIIRARSSRLPPLPPVAAPVAPTAPAFPDWDAGRVIEWGACGARGGLEIIDNSLTARTAKQAKAAFLAANPSYAFRYASPRSHEVAKALKWPGLEVWEVFCS